MAWFRCHNEACADHPGGLPQHDFWGQEPTCPECGLSGEAERVTQIVTIHFDPPHPKLKGHGLNHLACNTRKPVTKLAGMHAATGDVNVVNCPHCKETEAYQKAKGNPWGDIPPERKFSVEGRGIDLQDKVNEELKKMVKPTIPDGDGCC